MLWLVTIDTVVKFQLWLCLFLKFRFPVYCEMTLCNLLLFTKNIYKKENGLTLIYRPNMVIFQKSSIFTVDVE